VAVNDWIRTGGAFDNVIDFDAVVRDPQHPARIFRPTTRAITCTPTRPATRRWREVGRSRTADRQMTRLAEPVATDPLSFHVTPAKALRCAHILLRVDARRFNGVPSPLVGEGQVRGPAPAGADESVARQAQPEFEQACQPAHRTVRSEQVCFALPRESPHPVPLHKGEGLCRTALRRHGFL